MKVLLFNPYRDVDRYIPADLRPYAHFTPTELIPYNLLPLDMAYIAGVLKGKHEVNCIDAHVTSTQVEEVDFNGYDAVVINTAPYSHYRCCQTFVGHALEAVRMANKAGARTIIYGPHVTVAPEDFREANCVIVGEPDSVIEEALTGSGGVSGVIGPLSRPELSVPDYSVFDFSLYPSATSTQIFENHDFGTIGVISYSRGCPFDCGFCFRALAPNKVRRHTLAEVEAMLHELIEVRGCTCLFWEDLTFTLDKEWTLELCNLLKRWKVPYVIQTRVERMDADIARALAESGCYKVEMGVESGVEEILRQFNKRITWKEVVEAIRVAKEAGIPRVVAFAGLFAPGETRETIEETRRKFHDLGLRFYCNIWFPYPNTSLYKVGVDEGKIGRTGGDWNGLLPLAGTIGTKFTAEEVRQVCYDIDRREQNRQRLRKFFEKVTMPFKFAGILH